MILLFSPYEWLSLLEADQLPANVENYPEQITSVTENVFDRSNLASLRAMQTI